MGVISQVKENFAVAIKLNIKLFSMILLISHGRIIYEKSMLFLMVLFSINSAEVHFLMITL